MRKEINKILVSAIISTYNAENFIRGCLEDLIGQTLYKVGKLEIITINSGSLQNEELIIKEYQSKYKNIKYVRTERETLYSAWNQGIQLASGKYVTNANTDDRHRKDALEVMADFLEENPGFDLVYANSKISLKENETFDNCISGQLLINSDYDSRNTLLHYQFGPAPLWKKTVHEKIGYFNENYRAVGDYEFNIRFAVYGLKAKFLNETLTMYFKNPNSITFSFENQGEEKQKLLEFYRTPGIISQLYQQHIKENIDSLKLLEILQDQALRSLFYHVPGSSKRGKDEKYFSNLCAASVEVIKSQKINPEKRLVILVDQNNFSFIYDFISYLKSRNFVLVLDSNDEEQLKFTYEWADTVFIEWMQRIAYTFSNLNKRQRIITRLHSYEAFDNFIKLTNFQNIDDIVFVSEVMIDYLNSINIDIRNKSRVHIIPPGIDITKFAFKKRKHGFNFAFVGHLIQTKNIAFLLQIMKMLTKKDSRYRLHVFGEFVSDSGVASDIPKRYFLDQINKLGLSNNITLYGYIEHDRIVKEMSDINYLLSTSYRESLGLNIIEAMAMGIMPIIHSWPGAESIYPKEFLFSYFEEIFEKFELKYESEKYREFVLSKYNCKETHKNLASVILNSQDISFNPENEKEKGFSRRGNEQIKNQNTKNINENPIKNFSVRNLKILYLALASPSSPQIMDKIHQQLSVMKEYNSESGGLIIGHGNLTKKYSFEYVNFLDYNPNLDFNQFALALMDKYASKFNADIIYFRYPASNQFLYEFVRKHPNVVFEHQTKELNEFSIRKDKTEFYYKEQKFGGKVLSGALGITTITKDVAEYEQKRAERNIDYFVFGNGTWEDAAPIVNDDFPHKQVNILFTASFSPWHGFDRIIKGLSDYKGKTNFKIHVVGNGEKGIEYIELIKQLKLEDNFIFYGFKSGAEINRIANICHFAIGSLGLHRIGFDQVAPLKHREYCLRGIPFIYSGNDIDFSPELEFVHQVQADDSNIDFMHLEKFAKLRVEKPSIKQDARNYALTNLTWKIKINGIINFLVKLKNSEVKNVDTAEKKLFNRNHNFNKKILIACTHFWPSTGGVESIAEGLGNNLVERGYKVDVATIAMKERNSVHYKGMNIISLDPSNEMQDNMPVWSLELRNLILTGDYDSCILLADPLNKIIWSLFKAEVPSNTRLIIQPIINEEGYSIWKNNIEFRKGLKSVLKNANVVSISLDGLDAQFFNEESLPFSYIPNACNPGISGTDFRKNYNISSSSILILHVANLWRVKNHLEILKEFRNMPDNWKLVMIGYPSDDLEYVNEVKASIDKNKNVIFIPGMPKDEIGDAMKSADFIILGSKAEGVPVTILEAMSHGKTWVATPACGSIEINAGGLITFLSNFKTAIEFLLENPEIKNELCRLGKLQWLKTYNWNIVIKAWEQIILEGKTDYEFELDKNITQKMDNIKNQWEHFLKENIEKNKTQAGKIITQNSPLVSVIIPTYNRKDKLSEAIQSVFSQSYKNFEIIVINDAGTNVIDVINKFNDKRLKYFQHKTNKGLAAARNTGLKNALGKYIAYLDDDDIFYPDHLETLISFLQNNNYSIAYTDSYKATQELRKGDYVTIEKSVPFSNDFSREKLLELNIAPVLCFMHQKSCIEETGLFDESLKAHEDWDFWIRLSRKYDFAHIKKITVEFRQRTDKSNMTNSQNLDFYESYRDIIAKHYNLSKNNPILLKEQINNLHIIKQRAVIAGQILKKEIQPKVSIIIPVYNKVNLTKQCLMSLYKNTLRKIDFEVIIVDNASTDGTNEYLEFASNIFNNLRVITNSENLGFARSNNLGVKKAHGKYLLFLNNDTEVQKGWLESLLKVIENDSSVAAVGSKLLFPDGNLQHSGVVIIEDKQLPDPLVARHIYWKSPGDLKEANQLRTYQALTAACLLIKKNIFKKVGGFDEEYWNGYEDVDLCFKIGELGYNLVYQPESVVIHYESQSGPERFLKVVHNIELLHKKWLGRIQPDYILEKNGEVYKTPANKIKDYSAPGIKKQFSKETKKSSVYDISIIVLTYNGLEYTKQFIESLHSKTQNKFELLIIDNNSKDGTVEFLKELSENNNNVKVILNKDNLGFPPAVNQGLKKSTGKYIVIVNNDIVVTSGWLERMISIAEADPKVGLVGPVSNSVSGMQLDKEAKYSTITEMHNYAEEVKQKNTGSILEFPRVAFLCALIKKEVIEKIGGLDERFSPGNFEDDDFCLRAQIAGYKTVIAKDVFIHHFGSKSFAAEGLEKYRKRLETNQEIFVNKWGATPEEIWLQGKQIKGRNIMFTLDKNEFTENLQRALSLIEEKDFDVALDYLKNSVELYNSFEHDESDPELANLLNLAGNISLLNGNPETAQKYFENALNEDKNSSHACAGLGEVLFAKESYEAAKTMYEWGVKNNPENKAAIDGLAKVNKIFNLPEDDNSLFKPDEEMDFVNNSNENNESKADKLINEAYEMFNENRFSEALDKLSQAEKIFNGHLSSPDDIDFAASFYNMKGFNYLGLNDIDNAKACFQKALDINPVSSQACAGLGEILYLNKYDEQAKIMFKKAIEINPDNLFAVNGLEKINKILNNNHDKLKVTHRDDLGRLFNELELCGKGVEVGVQAGVYSQTLRNTWRGDELYLVDRWKYSSDYKDIANISDVEQKNIYLSVVNKFADDQSIQIIKKDSIQASKQFPDEFFDWIYLDADHSYNGCSNDLNAWYPKLKKGGIFAGHDYLDGEFIGGSFGVKSAVDDFIRDKDVNLYLTDENTIRSWYFVKPGSAIPSVAEIKTDEWKSDRIEKDNQKLQSVLNEILEASYELFNLKHFREAIETLNKSEQLFYLQNNKDLISSYENMKGFNYLGLDDKSGARKCFETALNINPESSQACAGLGELFYLDGKDKEAKTMYEYAVKNNPENPFAVSGLEKINKILDYPETHNTLMNY